MLDSQPLQAILQVAICMCTRSATSNQLMALRDLQEMFDRGESLIRQNPSKYMWRNIQVAVLLRRVRTQRRSVDYGRRSIEA